MSIVAAITPCKAMVGQLPARGSLSTPKQNTRRNSDSGSSSDTGSGGAPKKDMSAVKGGSPALFIGIALSSSFEGALAVANAKRTSKGINGHQASTAWGGGEINKRPLIIPLIYGGNGNSSSTVTIHSPDPCSKFHHGKDHGNGPVAISPMSPPAATCGNQMMTPLAQTPKGAGAFHDAVFSQQSDDDDNGFDDSFSSCHEFSPIGVDIKMKPSLPAASANGACPLIYGSNVTMESPDPCSKYHTGRGPVAVVSPITPLHSQQKSASLTVGNVLDDMASPDVLSKFHEERGSVRLAPALVASGRSSQGQAVADKAWRQLVLVQEKEESSVIEKDAWSSSSSSTSSHKQQQYRKASSRVSPVSVVEAFFNETVSPMKPNYETARMLIHNGVKLAAATNSNGNKTSPSEERSSPSAAVVEVFSNTLSPFKPNYNLVRENIKSNNNNNNKQQATHLELGASQQQQQQPTYFYKQPVRPAAPPPRSLSESGASKSFPRRFGLSGNNTSTNSSASQGQQKIVASPTSFSASQDKNNNNKENEDPNSSRTLRNSKSSSSIPSTSSSSLSSPSIAVIGNGANAFETSPGTSTGGKAPFKRGRQFKEVKATPTTMTEISCAMTELSRSGRMVSKEPLWVQSNGRWQSPQRASRRVRVSHLECKFHSNQHGSNKLPRKKRCKYERVLEALDELKEVCLGYPSFIVFIAPTGPLLLHRSNVFQDLSVVPRPKMHGKGQSEKEEEPEQEMEDENANSHLQLNSNIALAGKLRPAGLGKRGGGLAPLACTASTSANTTEPESEGSSCLVATLRDDTYGNWMKKQARTLGGCGEENDLFKLIADSNIEALKERLSPLSDDELHEAINNTRDARGNTLLIYATCLGNRRLVKLLLLLGADVNEANAFNNSPLHFAFEFCFSCIANYLIRKGADEYFQNDMARCPGERIEDDMVTQ